MSGGVAEIDGPAVTGDERFGTRAAGEAATDVRGDGCACIVAEEARVSFSMG